MKSIIQVVFSILMLSVFVTNSILEVVLAEQNAYIELADVSDDGKDSKEEKESKEDKDSKEEKESKEDKDSKEEKESKEDKDSKEEKEASNKFIETPFGLIGAVEHICLQKTRSAYHYADNLQNYSLELDTPPPEQGC
jgi:ABC-type Zn2+ transport system substrate-binding protein/surface adhesin